jgi:Flp pilus assembly protein TadD
MLNLGARLNENIQGRWRGAVIGGVLVVLTGCQTTSLSKTENEDPYRQSGVQTTMLQAGREAESASKFETAAGIYGRLYESRPEDSAVLTAFIRNMRYSGRAQQIVGYVEKQTPHMLADQNVKFEYAKALLAAGRKVESLNALKELRTQMPDQWQVFSAIGIAADSLEQYDEAMVAYRTALRISPNNEVVMNNMAMSEASAGHLLDAIDTLEKAAGINRTNPHIRQNLALLYAINGDVARAQTLAAMDLDVSDVETNLSFYRRFEGAVQ